MPAEPERPQLEEIKEAEEAYQSRQDQQNQEVVVSEGSHGELSDEDIDENIQESIPDSFPWQSNVRGNYLRQQGLTASQVAARVKSVKPVSWLFKCRDQPYF